MLRSAALFACTLFPISVAFSQSAPLEQRIGATLAERESALIAFRRDLHQHPEVSGEEARTAARVAERLRERPRMTCGAAARSGNDTVRRLVVPA